MYLFVLLKPNDEILLQIEVVSEYHRQLQLLQYNTIHTVSPLPTVLNIRHHKNTPVIVKPNTIIALLKILRNFAVNLRIFSFKTTVRQKVLKVTSVRRQEIFKKNEILKVFESINTLRAFERVS